MYCCRSMLDGRSRVGTWRYYKRTRFTRIIGKGVDKWKKFKTSYVLRQKGTWKSKWNLYLRNSTNTRISLCYSCCCEFSKFVQKLCNSRLLVETSFASCIGDRYILANWQVYMLRAAGCFEKVTKLVISLKIRRISCNREKKRRRRPEETRS